MVKLSSWIGFEYDSIILGVEIVVTSEFGQIIPILSMWFRNSTYMA